MSGLSNEVTMKYTEQYWDDVDRVQKAVPNLELLFGKNLFITGATGMICSALVDVLLLLNKNRDAGIKLVLAGRSRERMAARFAGFKEGKDYVFFQYDATKEADLKVKADYIIHGASNANPSYYVSQPVETMLANFNGLYSLLKMGKEQGTKRLLYLSSSEVYGNKDNNDPFKEADYGFLDILNPRACYPSAKRAAETLCASFSQEYGLETVIARPGHIYGPTISRSDSRASAQFTRNAVNHEDIVMKSAGQQLRSYCYTLDCASALLTILLNGENANAYNISNRNSVVTIRQLAEALAKAAGTQVVFENPTDAEKKGYNLMTNSSLDAEKLEALGWQAEFSLEEGAQRTIAGLKAEQSL